MIDPETTTNTGAPTAAAAYADAPPIIGEMSEVLILSGRLARPGGRTPQAVREQRLRKAALLDRIALKEGDTIAPEVAVDAVHVAASAAADLALYDLANGTGTGPVGPGSPEWHPSHRPYVRQEYAAWQRHQ